MQFTFFLAIIQFIFSAIIGMYFLSMLHEKQSSKEAIIRKSQREMEKLKKLRQTRLSEPLSEATRPSNFNEIIGQEQGIRALRAAICGPNPQHVIIYGPPGIGKTAAARLVLEEAKTVDSSPFKPNSKFIEADATIMRYDERNIADPLIGSVHDPIYQGAGAYGQAGVPQPKPGAVTKAHGGVLFIDEIGELHNVQMNKLLKVLEDRKVFLESAYYNEDDSNIPLYIHDIFKTGLPADFRLIGATTRSPDDIPPAIRSRCVEVFFRALSEKEIIQIARNAATKGGFIIDSGVDELIARFSQNGRDAVNMVQIAGSLIIVEGRKKITIKDIEWVIESGRYSPRYEKFLNDCERIGCVNGLAVMGLSNGVVLDIEAVIGQGGNGKIELCGVTEEEQINTSGRSLKRTATAKASVKNSLTVLKNLCKINLLKHDIHINIPGGMPVDGPSAGIAIFSALYSAALEIPIDGRIAMTGELSITGKIKPVGGVASKIQAAIQAGAKMVFIPKDNWQEQFEELKITVIPVENITELISLVFPKNSSTGLSISSTQHGGVISASGI